MSAIRATDWEFRNRAFIFGALYGLSFFFYSFDHANATAVLADRLSFSSHVNSDTIAHVLLAIAAAFGVGAAFMRTWASAYLHRDIVYASEVKSASLVAGGPYRFVRNPLYFGNLVMAMGVGALASRSGFVFLALGTLVFDYRLILREESDLASKRGEAYADFLRAVPRLFPSPWPRVPRNDQQPQWAAGFRAEAWFWAFALGLIAFAITLDQRVLWGVIVAGLLASWLLSRRPSK